METRVVFLEEVLSAEAEWQAPTLTSLLCLLYLSLHCPHPIKICISDIFQPPPPKLSKTAVKHAQCCPSLWLRVGSCQFQNTQQLSVQVIGLNWATTATVFKWSYGDLSNGNEQRNIPQGEATASNVACTRAVQPCCLFQAHLGYSSGQAALETTENIIKLYANTLVHLWGSSYLNHCPSSTHGSSSQDSISIITDDTEFYLLTEN